MNSSHPLGCCFRVEGILPKKIDKSESVEAQGEGVQVPRINPWPFADEFVFVCLHRVAGNLDVDDEPTGSFAESNMRRV